MTDDEDEKEKTDGDQSGDSLIKSKDCHLFGFQRFFVVYNG